MMDSFHSVLKSEPPDQSEEEEAPNDLQHGRNSRLVLSGRMSNPTNRKVTETRKIAANR